MKNGFWMTAALCAVAVLCRGEVLYNGITLPETWPPRDGDLTADTPMRVPYLEHPPAVIDISVGRQLFVDDFLLESCSWAREFHLARKFEGNPVFKSETPLERGQDCTCFLGHGGVFWDPEAKKLLMFYSAGRLDGSCCLATSTDGGLHWDRPDVGLGFGKNVLIPYCVNTKVGPADNCIWLDTLTTNKNERFKYLILRDRHYLATSPDAKHWSVSIPAGRADDYCSFFYNPFRNVWVYSVKQYNPKQGRHRFYAESPNFMTPLVFDRSVYWCNADRDDPMDPVAKCKPQLYSLNAVAYESLIVGIFYVHLGPPNEICEKGKYPKITTLKLGFTRDGFHWSRPDRRSFIAPTLKDGTWDRAYLHSTAGVFFIDGDRLVFPYCAFPGITQSGKRGMHNGGSIGLAYLRRDGFASLNAGEEECLLETRPLKVRGAELFVNLDAPKGTLKIEMLSMQGKPIATAEASSFDSTCRRLVWSNPRAVAQAIAKPVQLRMRGRNAKLYSFWLTPAATGESWGYLAAGQIGSVGIQEIPTQK